MHSVANMDTRMNLSSQNELYGKKLMLFILVLFLALFLLI